MDKVKTNRCLLTISSAAVIVILVQIMLGAVTRLTGSGLSCPDWPLCYGLWFPFPSALSELPSLDYTYGQVFLEWAHRANAAIVLAPVICCMVFMSWRYRTQEPMCWRFGLVAIFLLVLQSAVGGLTVFDSNSPWSVAVHLFLASLLLATAVSMLRIAKSGYVMRLNTASLVPLGFAALILLTMVSGAIVAKTGSALSCGGWPLCNGSVFPALDDINETLHFSHRMLALVTVVGLVWAGWYMRELRHAMLLSLFQVLMGLGVILVYEGGALGIQVTMGALHQLFAIIIFVALVWAFWTTSRVE